MSEFIKGNMIHEYMIEHNIPTKIEEAKNYYIVGTFTGRQLLKIEDTLKMRNAHRVNYFDSSVDLIIYTKTMPQSLLRPYKRFKEVEYMAYEDLFEPVLGTNFFMNKQVCLLGHFVYYDYEKIKQMFLQQNCIIQNRIIDSTDVLVCGDDLDMEERMMSYTFDGVMITEKDLLKYII